MAKIIIGGDDLEIVVLSTNSDVVCTYLDLSTKLQEISSVDRRNTFPLLGRSKKLPVISQTFSKGVNSDVIFRS
jgi:hypothetical protein